MTVLPMPSKSIISSIEKIIFNLKRDKIKRTTLRSKHKSGGLQIPDIPAQANSLKTIWIKKYKDVEINVKGKAVVRNKLTPFHEFDVFDCSLSKKMFKQKVASTFWREILSAWTLLTRALLVYFYNTPHWGGGGYS